MKIIKNASPARFAQAVALKGDSKWVIDTETDGLLVRGPRARHRAIYLGALPLSTDICYVWGPGFSEGLGPILDILSGVRLIGHSLRFDLHALNWEPRRAWEDTMNMKYFLNTPGRKSLDDICKAGGRKKIKTPEALKKGRIMDVPFDEVAVYLADDCAATSFAYDRLASPYSRQAPDWDMALEPVVYAMERRGVRFIPEAFAEVRRTAHKEEKEAEKAVRGKGFRGLLSSPAQVGEWLVQDFGLDLPQTKTGAYSSAADVIEPLCHPASDAVIRWRKAYKLRTSFLETLPSWVQDGTIHCSLRTSNTVTGRLSCAEPNLQQIPKRTDIGKAFRKCFTGPSGSVTVADYSQMEMRVAAALSGDEALGDIFSRGADLHDEVARQIGGVGRGDVVSPDLRVKAKAVNFGILNGMRPKRLAQKMSEFSGYQKTYTIGEAKVAYDAFLNRFPQLADWMADTWAEAREFPVVQTEAGRTRPFDLDESRLSAVSVRVQGTAAEMVRIALIMAEEAGLKPILQVHDEILLDGAGKSAILSEVMEEAARSAFKSTSEMKYAVDAEDRETWG